MPVSPDVMEIVRILDEEGFSALAGELLSEVAQGIELDAGAGDADLDVEETPEPIETPWIRLDDGKPIRQRYFDTDGGKGDPPPRFLAIAEDEQLAFAMSFLQLRLVEPVRRLAEAERIAGELMAPPDQKAAPAPKPLGSDGDGETKEDGPTAARITFSAPTGHERPYADRTAKPGLTVEADALAEVLERISMESQ